MAREFLVYDSEESCPYLPGRTARMPLRQPLETLTGFELDEKLAAGDRRCGPFLYGTRCAACQACQPIRLEVDRFQPSSTQRRVFRQGEKKLRTVVGEPIADATRIALYNKHRELRGLNHDGMPITISSYRQFLVDSCCDTLELSYLLGDELVAVAIVDRGAQAVSAVYCYFDPDFSSLSPGVYSVLKQIELTRQWERKHLYLGYFIADSPHMRYKANYRPYQLRIDGEWIVGGQRDC